MCDLCPHTIVRHMGCAGEVEPLLSCFCEVSSVGFVVVSCQRHCCMKQPSTGVCLDYVLPSGRALGTTEIVGTTLLLVFARTRQCRALVKPDCV